MRTTIVAMIFASGTMIALPAQAQQTTPNSQTQQMQDEADKRLPGLLVLRDKGQHPCNAQRRDNGDTDAQPALQQ